MRDKTCCLTGHRKLPEVGRAKIAFKTKEAIEELFFNNSKFHIQKVLS